VNLFDSITGVVAIVMIFGLPIIAIVGAVILILAVSQKRHKERMKMIEQGMMPAPSRRRTGNFYALIITGAIMLAFGLALFIPALVGDGDIEGGLIFGLVGLAMILVYAYLRSLRSREARRDDPPPAVPPQT
jgi:hypothetical protein